MLSKSFGYALVVGALAIGGTTACGTSPTSDDESAAVGGDPWAVPASTQTSSALGIQSWGFREIAEGELSISGYDADHQRVVEIRQRMTALDSYNWRLDLGVARAGATAMLQYALGTRSVDAGTQVTGVVGNDSLSADAVSRKVLEQLRADVGTPSPSASPSGSGQSLTSSSLQALDPAAGSGTALRPMSVQMVGDNQRIVSGGQQQLVDKDGDGKDDRCEGDQASQQCGGNMMQSIAPVLGALGSAGSSAPQAFSTLLQFAAIYKCTQGDETQAGMPKQPIAIFDLAKCAMQQQQQGGQNGQSANPAEGLMSGLSMLTGMTQAMQSMGQMGQSCPQNSCQGQ